MLSRLQPNGRRSPAPPAMRALRRVTKMRYSYTQLASYLRCPRSYRFRYLDGWREKETRAAMTFGRCFEQALVAYFCGQDCGATLFQGGVHFVMSRLPTKRGIPGTGWCIRVCIYSNDSHK